MTSQRPVSHARLRKKMQKSTGPCVQLKDSIMANTSLLVFQQRCLPALRMTTLSLTLSPSAASIGTLKSRQRVVAVMQTRLRQLSTEVPLPANLSSVGL